MGMYTELNFNAALLQNTPDSVLSILGKMVNGDDISPEGLPDHELFKTSRWDFMLVCDSCYFDARTHSELCWDDVAKRHNLCIQCNLKNYDNEIDKFIDWVTPYLDKSYGEFLGYQRYEESDKPRLIFMTDNHA